MKARCYVLQITGIEVSWGKTVTAFAGMLERR